MLFRAICASALLLSGSTAHAQTDYPDELPPSRPLSTVIDEKYDWAARVDSGRAIAPLGDALFGDATSYYDGSTSFTVTDVDLPGNNALPVNITRMHRASDPQGFPTAGMLGEWDLELPHVRGTFARTQGWQVEIASIYFRLRACRNFI